MGVGVGAELRCWTMGERESCGVDVERGDNESKYAA